LLASGHDAVSSPGFQICAFVHGMLAVQVSVVQRSVKISNFQDITFKTTCGKKFLVKISSTNG